ncbi:N-acetylmuramoyl-L-alanine amidase family protein [Paenibacillus sp. y28]|uniref:N-acetylmuramoyl-L-alanine amidase family protein n=1 Tax=Paenibacillus sp. y28 TaxID=3129110 RepID=UPI003017DC87
MKTVKLWLLLVLLLICLPQTGWAAETPIHLFLNGQKLAPEVNPQIAGQGVTLVPVRIVAEELGAGVKWNEQARTVTIEQNAKKIVLKIDSRNAEVDGKAGILEEPATIVGGNTLVPVRFVSEALGIGVKWDEETRSVHLFKKDEADSGSPVSSESGAGSGAAGPNSGSAGNGNSGGTTKPNGSSASGSSGSQTGAATGGPSPIGTADAQLALISKISAETDKITVQASKPLIANAFALDKPDRIVIDLPGAGWAKVLNGTVPVQNGEIESRHPEILKIRYSLFSSEPAISRIVIDLKSKQDYTITSDKNTGLLTIVLKKEEPKLQKKYTVVLDAGHGGTDPGTRSVDGKNEKDFTLPMQQKVAALLEKDPNIEVQVTRTTDVKIELSDRIAQANKIKADLFLSIHGNSFPDNRAIRGTETYFYLPDGRLPATILHKHVLEATGFPDRKVKQNNYKVLREAEVPATLLEIGFLSNQEENSLIWSEAFQQKVAEAIAAGVKEFLSSKEE